MERHEILDAMSELKLYGMRASFDEIAGKGLARRDEVYPLIASLIRAEHTHRQARSISYRISGAKFPVLKDLDSFVFADTPVDQGQVRELATGAFPGGKSVKHHHAGSVFVFVLSGAVQSESSATGPVKVYKAGESFFEPPGSEHLVSENASATEPASLLAVFVADDGAQLTTFDK
jgi:quercetin dioxygenase-like cupin family protein